MRYYNFDNWCIERQKIRTVEDLEHIKRNYEVQLKMNHSKDVIEGIKRVVNYIDNLIKERKMMMEIVGEENAIRTVY